MKKLIYCAAALATALFAGSCQQELLETTAGENTVTYTVAIPSALTKASAEDHVARIGDGSNVDQLIYEVWKTGEADQTDLYNDAVCLYQEETSLIKGENGERKAVITLNLVQDQEYTILFWAQVRGTGNYTTSDLRNVRYAKNIRSEYNSNVEDYAAFYAVDFVSDSDPKSKKVSLTRPFAQLNLGTLNTADKYTVAMVESEVSVKGVPTGFNVAEKKALGEGNVKFNYYAVPQYPDSEIEVSGKLYQYAAMNYIFADNQKRTTTVTYNIKTKVTSGAGVNNEVVTENVVVNNTIDYVPLQENYRTNIVGNLLTSTTQYEVVVNADWAGADLAPDPIYMAAALGGNVTLTDDVELTTPLDIKADMTLNLNGKTIAGAMTVAEGANVTIENGTISNTNKEVSGITTNGILTLNNVQIVSARHAVRVESGKVVINGGTYKVVPISNSTLHALNVGDNNTKAEVIIKGGTFIGPKGTMADSGSAVNVRTGSKVVIEGGDFSGGKTKTVSCDGEMTITGGSFDQTPAAYVAEGYKVMEKDGKFYVVSEDVEAVVNSKEDLPVADDGKLDTVFEENTTLFGDITVSASETTADSSYGATGVQVKDGAVLDGQGHTLTVNNAWTTWDCIVNTNGGTIKNLTVNGAMRGIFMGGATTDVYIDNVIFKNVIYTFNSDGGNKNYGVYISNSTLNGWTSHSDVHKEVVYTNCSFGEGNGYKFCRPYGPTSYINCDFCEGYTIEPIGKVTFENCTIGGVALTAYNVATLVTSTDNVESVNGYALVDGLWINEGTAIVTSPDKVQAAFNNSEIHTIYLNSGKYVVDMYNGTAKRESLTIIGTEGTQFAHSAAKEGQLLLNKFDRFTIRNCEILKRVVGNKNWGMMVFAGSDKGTGVYTVENCTFKGVGTQGIYINETASGTVYNIKNCTFDGDFGGEGAITIQDKDDVMFTVNVTGCTFNNIPSTSHEVCLIYGNGDFTLESDSNLQVYTKQ